MTFWEDRLPIEGRAFAHVERKAGTTEIIAMWYGLKGVWVSAWSCLWKGRVKLEIIF
jgi:hypothetical protein